MVERYVQVLVHVKIYAGRCTVGLQRMGIFQTAENTEVRKNPMRSQGHT
jgi:hypothetical protein